MEQLYGELIVQDGFDEIINELKEKKVELPDFHTNLNDEYVATGENGNICKVNIVGTKIEKIALDPFKGHDFFQKQKLSAYDESIDKYSCLEGDLYVTAHSLIHVAETEYLPLGFVTANFYTKSIRLSMDSKYIKKTDSLSNPMQVDYVKDKINLLRQKCLNGSIVLIDGPLIAGDVYTYMIKLLKEFVEKDIIPVFFVKNSNSDLVTQSIEELKGEYNSDLHWSSRLLKRGERTNYFLYTDLHNPSNSKVFCYCRLFDGSPQRVEFYADSFFKNQNIVDRIMDCIYYMAILQGQSKNPQIRPIAIAERYAREYIKLCDIKETFRKLSSTIPVVNEERFRRD